MWKRQTATNVVIKITKKTKIIIYLYMFAFMGKGVYEIIFCFKITIQDYFFLYFCVDTAGKSKNKTEDKKMELQILWLRKS